MTKYLPTIPMEAVQFTGDNMDEVKEYCDRVIKYEYFINEHNSKDFKGYVIKIWFDDDPEDDGPEDELFKKGDYFAIDVHWYWKEFIIVPKDEFESQFREVKE